MQNYSKPRHIWRAIYPLMIYLGMSILIAVVAAVSIALGELSSEVALSTETLDQEAILERAELFLEEHGMMLQLIASTLGLAVFVLMWRKIRTGIPQYENSKLSPLVVVLTVLACAGANYALIFIISITNIMRFFPDYEEIARLLSGGSLIERILVIGFVAPAVEELLCRGIIFNRLSSWMPVWAAVLISSALFGVIHMNLFQGMYAFLIGAVFCLLYVRYRNLWVPIIGHMAFNLANLAITEAFAEAGSEENSVFIIIISGMLIAIVCTAYLMKHTKAAVLTEETNAARDCEDHPL